MISNVVISPDGKHIAALTSSDGAKITISVWRTDALDKPPTIIGSTRVTFKNLAFLRNDRLRVVAMQPKRTQSYTWHQTQSFQTDLEGKSWTEPLAPSLSDKSARAYDTTPGAVIDFLPNDPKRFLVVDRRVETSGDVYKVDIYTNKAERVDHIGKQYRGIKTDFNGEIRGRTETRYDENKIYVVNQIRNSINGSWEDHFKSYFKDRNDATLEGFGKDPNIAYVSMIKVNGKRGVYVYDIAARKFLEPLFEHKLFNASGVILDEKGELLGVRYIDARDNVYWVDEHLAARLKAARAALGVRTEPVAWTDPDTGLETRLNLASDFDVSIAGWSRDRTTLVIAKSGPQLPTEYYLSDSTGKLRLLGGARPWIKSEALGETRLVQYAARDGLVVPAFLTTPPAGFGPGPHPTIILPHAGPWERDFLRWNAVGWVQYFASRGYVVLQPQFRGSYGWGEKLWRAGDKEWGGKMQDDKDDGAKWLIDQKLADPGRIAMLGYGYGGYAALVAAIRPNGLYQCSVSGAGSSLADMKKITWNSRVLREYQAPSIEGLDAQQNADQVKIPVFLYHGDFNDVIALEGSRRFVESLKAAGKPYKWLEIKGMDYANWTMTPEMMETQLVEIDKFFQNECKPGGL
ncbi:S9 family peptidase [Caulobacter radicis]|nr:S9 family peptidase [Caulobacter radicis]